MEHRQKCWGIFLMLPLLFFFMLDVYADSANSLPRNLSVSFSSRHKGQDPGYVFGKIRNKSTNAYACVRIEFDLSTRFDLRHAKQKGRHLGVFAVEVKNLQPREVRDYKKRLPYPAGIGLKSVRECLGHPTKGSPPKRTAPPPKRTAPPPKRTAPTTCSIKGQVFGKLEWNTRDDRGHPVSWVLTHISMMRPGASRSSRAKLHRGKYAFADVPAGRKYKIFPEGFRSSPAERSVSCRPNTTHSGVNFTITGPPLD
jgi:hypothetical protein